MQHNISLHETRHAGNHCTVVQVTTVASQREGPLTGWCFFMQVLHVSACVSSGYLCFLPQFRDMRLGELEAENWL